MEAQKDDGQGVPGEPELAAAATLPTQILDELFSDAVIERKKTGHHLFLQDDRSENLYFLRSGTVEISIYSIAGKKLVANIVRSGSLIGEVGALDGGMRTATATCIEDCEILVIGRTRLLAKISTNPEIANALIALLCARVRWVSGELGDQAHLKIEQRLAKRLTMLGRLMAGSDGWIAIPQAELAEFLGATRESVNKILTQWRRLGLLELKRGSVRIVDHGRLQEFAAKYED
jgi:CRP/FNR family cyclic AMP-dependent transcriptional regulator